MQKPNITRPLLAAALDEGMLKDLHYPVLASPKLDGIRVRVFPEQKDDKTVNVAMSRAHKPIPNRFVQRMFREHPDWVWLDGEIIVGSANNPICFNFTQSSVMSEAGEPKFKFHVFDCFEFPDKSYTDRLNRNITADGYLDVVPQELMKDSQELLAYESKVVGMGFEGIMVRKLDGRYKFGRSTESDGILWKLKRMYDAEAVIIGAYPLQHNLNQGHRDERGFLKRSTHKAGKKDSKFIGKFRVSTVQWGDFNVGTNGGRLLMADLGKYIGKTVTFTYQKAGMKDVPRIPIFKGFRGD